jgi:hypothetical protein
MVLRRGRWLWTGHVSSGADQTGSSTTWTRHPNPGWRSIVHVLSMSLLLEPLHAPRDFARAYM